MKKFEYKSVRIDSGKFEKVLNELGKEGWELIYYSDSYSVPIDGFAYLKREIIEKDEKILLNENKT